MKIFLLIGMVIIFISVFFILSISERVVVKYKACLEYQDAEHCDVSGLGKDFAEGMLVIACFVLIDVVVINLLVKHYLKREEDINWETIT